MFTTPVLFLVFNRPDTTEKVFAQIRKIQPTFLYIAADGPRTNKPGEKEICEEVRNLVLENIDWHCEVKTLFRDKNLGCGRAVSQAITWFFEHVEEGIILEDDTVPSLCFFNFCNILLDRYRDNSEVMIISGNNFQNGINRGDGSYYFTKYVHIWGWATWKRTWDLYDFKIQKWKNLKNKNCAHLFINKEEKNYWINIFDKMYEHQIDTWDYQLFFLTLTNQGLNIVPNINLVSNIGFNESSTHTKDHNHPLANLKANDDYKDKRPQSVYLNKDADLYLFNSVYNPSISSNLMNHNRFIIGRYVFKIFKKVNFGIFKNKLSQ